MGKRSIIAPRPKEQLARMLDAHKQLGPRKPTDPLRPLDEMLILALNKSGTYGNVDISRIVKVSPQTVAKVLMSWDDTRLLARQHIDSRALEMASRFVEQAEPPELLKALGKIDVVRDDKPGESGSGVTIIIGSPDSAHPMRPPVIDVKP